MEISYNSMVATNYPLDRFLVNMDAACMVVLRSDARDFENHTLARIGRYLVTAVSQNSDRFAFDLPGLANYCWFSILNSDQLDTQVLASYSYQLWSIKMENQH